jgi:hypothetical protein
MFPSNTSGIKSLAGFSYQIRVFTYYLIDMKQGMRAEFETLEDVNINNSSDDIDNNLESYTSKIRSHSYNEAIQVKRTNISNSNAEKILLNWILLENSKNNISNFVLFTDSKYNNTDNIFIEKPYSLYRKIIKSNKKADAIISKVKAQFENNYEEFKSVYNSIKNKYVFESVDDIDTKIENKCIELFRKAGVCYPTYIQRIKELLNYVNVEIMNSINSHKPFIITYDEFMRKIEDISYRITDNVKSPDYCEFKRNNKINFSDLNIANSREYKQLCACELPQSLIEVHLTYKAYYEYLRFSYLETNKQSNIKNIEELSSENFENVKFQLRCNSSDQPINRLNGTKRESNSYASNEQIKYGSCIYLTNGDIDKGKQISWEDKLNE